MDIRCVGGSVFVRWKKILFSVESKLFHWIRENDLYLLNRSVVESRCLCFAIIFSDFVQVSEVSRWNKTRCMKLLTRCVFADQ